MSFEKCHIEYDLTRRQRLVSHLGVWAPHLGSLIIIGIGGSVLVGALTLYVSPWYAFLILLPSWFVRNFARGLINVILVPKQHIDILLEEGALGIATPSDRLWMFLDGIIRIQKYSKDVWTILHYNGTVIHIPVDAIDEKCIEYMRKKGEWGKTREGVQAIIERGKKIKAIEAQEREERQRQLKEVYIPSDHPVVQELEMKFLPYLVRMVDEISRDFLNVKANLYSNPVGTRTDYQGHSIGIDCLLLDANPDQVDNIDLGISVRHLNTDPEIERADVCWGHPSGSIEAELFQAPVAYNKGMINRLEERLPELYQALRKALERGQPLED